MATTNGAANTEDWISAGKANIVDEHDQITRAPLVKKDDNATETTSKFFSKTSAMSSSDNSDCEILHLDKKYQAPPQLSKFFAKTTVLQPAKARRRFLSSSEDEDDQPSGSKKSDTVTLDDEEDLLNGTSASGIVPETDFGSESSAVQPLKGRIRAAFNDKVGRRALFKPKRRFGGSSSEDDDVQVAKHVTKPKPSKSISMKKKKPRVEILSSDEEEEEVPDNDNETYEEDDLAEYLESTTESSSDEEPDSPVKKPRRTAAKKQQVATLKEETLKFVQQSTVSELMDIPGVARKVAENIVELKPFKDWHDLKEKLENLKNTRKDVLEAIVKTLQSRRAVNKIMDECLALSDRISACAKDARQTSQPSVLNKQHKLSEYQLVGLNWLLIMHQNKTNAILADEMGLGKTIQVIAFLAALREKYGITGPHLIVVPSSTLDNWDRELAQWCKKIDVLVYHGNQAQREIMRVDILKKRLFFDVMLTTYDVVRSNDDKVLFKKYKFKYAIFDEAHMLKNMKSQRYDQLLRIQSQQRLMLTGTPLQNNLLELMSLLMFTVPHMFHMKVDHVKALFSAAPPTTKKDDDSRTQTSYETQKIELAKRIMKPFVLRRLKKDVLTSLPKKTTDVAECDMATAQKKQYFKLIDKFTVELNTSGQDFEDDEFEVATDVRRGAGMLMHLRKCANHPLLVRSHYTDAKLKNLAKLLWKNEERFKSQDTDRYIFEDMQQYSDFEMHRLCKMYPSIQKFKLDDKIILDSGKFKKLDEMLPALKENKQKVLIFSQFVMMMDIIEEYLDIRKHKYLRLDGSTKVEDRLDLIDEFTENSDVFIFLLSTRAGGMGINLTSAQNVIIHDPDFNPTMDKQAEDRCHRIGQTKPVTVTKLISKDTVEEGIWAMQQKKLKLGEHLYDTDQSKTRHRRDEIANSLVFAGKADDKRDMKTLLQNALQQKRTLRR